jgi:hypothetical protein
MKNKKKFFEGAADLHQSGTDPSPLPVVLLDCFFLPFAWI